MDATTSNAPPDAGRWQMTWRDRLAHRLANAALRIASQGYRDRLRGTFLYGFDSAARDAVEGLEPPPPWRESAAKYQASA